MPTATVIYKYGCTHTSHCVCVCACVRVGVFSIFTLPGISEEESITYAQQINSAFKHTVSRGTLAMRRLQPIS